MVLIKCVYSYLKCVGASVYMYVCIPEYVPGVHEGQTRAFNPLELKLWIDVSYHVGPGR